MTDEHGLTVASHHPFKAMSLQIHFKTLLLFHNVTVLNLHARVFVHNTFRCSKIASKMYRFDQLKWSGHELKTLFECGAENAVMDGNILTFSCSSVDTISV